MKNTSRKAHQTLAIAAALWLVTVPTTAQGVVISADALLGAGDMALEGQDITVSGARWTIAGPHRFRSLTLESGAVLSSSAGESLALTIEGDVVIKTGCRVDVAGLGYAGTSAKGGGPGGGNGVQSDAAGGAGGGHGGWGGIGQTSYQPGGAYGSAQAPTDLGSAGGAGYAGTGGAGGGAIRLVIGGALTIEGLITADGAHGKSHSYGASGGGAGGSIWLTTGSLKGAGAIRAAGGNGPQVSEEDAGGGSGGRIAVEFGVNQFTGSISVLGGEGYQRGGAGTILLKGGETPLGALLVDAEGKEGPSTFVALAGPLDRFVVRSKGMVVVAAGSTNTVRSLQIAPESTVVCPSLDTGAQKEGQWVGSGVTWLTEEARIEAGGALTASGRGYTGTDGTGSGPGGGTGTRADTNGGGGGGAYGGNGGQPQSSFRGGASYGSAIEPAALGSAGGAGYAGVGGAGGGAIRLIVTNALTVDGLLAANGSQGILHGYGASGGGSGGSLWITTRTLAGSGIIAANGGAGPIAGEEDGGGGGGGRIAIGFETNEFAGLIEAVGGPGYQRGGAGTVLLKPPGDGIGRLLVDAGGLTPTHTPAPFPFRYNELRITNGALFEVNGGEGVEVYGRLLVATNSAMWCRSKNRSAQVETNWAGQGVSLLAGDLQIDPGGMITAEGQGYTGTEGRGDGPGGGTGTRSDTGGGGGGGGHGGDGGQPQSPFAGGPGNGSIVMPRDLGSAGGAGRAGPGGAGGGAIRLVVTNALLVDGVLSVNGAPGLSHVYGASGGGAGGSLWIVTGSLSGSGTICANGGAGPIVSEEDGGGGGGGRIAIYYHLENTFGGEVAATGGSGYQAGGAGTVFWKSPAQPLGDLVLNNDGRAGAATPWDAAIRLDSISTGGGARLALRALEASWSGSSLVIGEGTTLTLAGSTVLSVRTLSVATNGTLICEAINNDAMVNDQWAGRGPRIEATDLTIEAGGRITGDGQGYRGTSARGNGPGGGTGTTADTNGGGGGGGYGGDGGQPQSPFAGGPGNGSMAAPLDLGSAGGAGRAGAGGTGGGAIRVIVYGQLLIDGLLSVDGANGLSHVYGASGGGAGGSLWVSTGKLAGSGLISANGGGGPVVSEEDGGGGSGGRLAIYFGTNEFTGTFRAAGGSGYQAGGAGTVFLKSATQSFGSLWMDNQGAVGAFTPCPGTVTLDALSVAAGGRLSLPSAGQAVLGQLTLAEKSLFQMGGQSALSVGELLIHTNGTLLCQSLNDSAQVDGRWAGEGVTVTAFKAAIESGGSISASGQGYRGTDGLGLGPSGGAGTRADSPGGGGGGAHGGRGGRSQGNLAGGSTPYGSELEPVGLGSAGGAGYAGQGGRGGGAIRLIVSDLLQVDGSITADGVSGASHGFGASGGGAGGSVWISAGTLTGAGLIAARGGQGPIVGEEDGGGGGGGRIAIATLRNEFAGIVSAVGGGGFEAGVEGSTSVRAGLACTVSPLTAVSGIVPLHFQVRFSEPVTDFDLEHVTVVGGRKLALSGTGAEFYVVVAPILPGAVTVQIPADSAHTVSGVANEWSNLGTTVFAPTTPVILAPPEDQTVNAGQRFTIGVIAAGTEPLAYLWHKDGQPLAATNAILEIASVTLADQGAYHVVVTNPLGSTPTEPVTLTVIDPNKRPELSIALEPNYQSRLLLTGVAGVAYRLEFANDLTDTTQWQTLATLTLGATGNAETTDQTAPGRSRRFYRAVVVP